MRGIAEQRRAALDPAHQRAARAQRPLEQVLLRHGFDDLGDVRMPAGELRGELRHFGRDAPALVLPARAFGERDEVQQPAAANGVTVDHVSRTDPDLARRIEGLERHLLDRHEAAPGDVAGELDLFGTEQRGAHARPDAIGPDQHVAAAPFAVVEAHRDAGTILLEIREAMTGDDRVRIVREHGFREHALQVGAVDHVVALAVGFFEPLAARHLREHAAALVMPHDLVIRCVGVFTERVEDAERMQAERTVRADRQTRADFTELRRLLEDPDPEAGTLQADARRESTDAAADDDDFAVIHDRTLLTVT
jgi:hypothetical protein